MDNNSTNQGNNTLLITFMLGIFSWLTPERVDIGLKVITAVGAIVATIFTVRYHIIAAKREKAEIKRLEQIHNQENNKHERVSK